MSREQRTGQAAMTGELRSEAHGPRWRALVLTRTTGDGLHAAVVESALWLGAALAFGGVLWLWRGPAAGGQYLAGYLLERALSVDNIFVFVLLFASMQVPAALQRRILFLGVVGALVLRGVFIAAGGALIDRVSWIFYVFGTLVLLAGARMFRAGEGGSPAGNNLAVRGLRRVLPVSERYDGGRLITRMSGRAMATPLLVALVAIAVTDVVFALDSIPAVFGVTRDLFIVFTSNAFAVLGLSLVVIAVVAGGAVAASLWRERSGRRPAPASDEVSADHEARGTVHT